MAFLARYDYLSRIGALSPMQINALLNLPAPPLVSAPRDVWPARRNVDFGEFGLKGGNGAKIAKRALVGSG
jgi:hypothetical protein